MKWKLLILSQSQFGYFTDIFKYCEYLKDDFDIHFLGWDYNLMKVEHGFNIKTNHVNRQGNILIRNLRMLIAFNKAIKSEKYAVVFCTYFRFISILKILNPHTKFIFDVRTFSVDKRLFQRWSYNFLLKLERRFFKNVTVISEGIARQLSPKACYILPLGADCISLSYQKKNALNILYVGTLQNRDIIKCVIGFNNYIQKYSNSDAHFTIIGDSNGNELNDIKAYIQQENLERRVSCLGRIRHSELKKYFDVANIGVSFVPLKPYFEYQPPTKTFEYLLSGIPVIATKTSANKQIVYDDPECILINDTVEDFEMALNLMSKNIESIDYEKIVSRYLEHTWANIVFNILKPYLLNVINNNI